MRIEHLEYLIKVVENGSITSAANELYISPQGVSQALKQLEKDLSIALFSRKGNKLEPTRAGRLAYESGKKILATNNELRINLNLLRAAKNPNNSEKLTIFATHSANATYLPSVLSAFHKLYPFVKVHVVETDSKQVLEGLENRGKAVTLFGLPETVFQETLKKQAVAPYYHLLLKEKLRVYVAENSPLTSKSAITLEDLRHAPLVLYHTERRMFSELFHENEANFNIILSSSNHNICRTMVANDENAVGFTNRISENYTSQDRVVTKDFFPEVSMLFGYFLTNVDIEDKHILDLVNLIENEIDKIISL